MKNFSSLMKESSADYRHFESISDQVMNATKARDALKYGSVTFETKQHDVIDKVVKDACVQYILDGIESAPDKEAYKNYLTGFLGGHNKIGVTPQEAKNILSKVA